MAREAEGKKDLQDSILTEYNPIGTVHTYINRTVPGDQDQQKKKKKKE
jgi:hypothetical protein